MRCRVLFVLFLTTGALAQSAPKLTPQREVKSVTVPITLDHNRVIINVDLPLPDGSAARVRGWVDNGNPDFYLSRRVATLMGLAVDCDDKACSATPPREITIGGMTILLAAVKEAKIPLRPVAAAAATFPGMSAEINIPSAILRNYDVLINFPGHEFTIGQPGTLNFTGG